MSSDTINSLGIAAEYLHKSLKTFQNLRPTLEAAGFPSPLNIPGNPVWLRQDIENWLLTRRAPAPTPEKTIEIQEESQSQAVLEKPTAKAKRGRGRPRNSQKSGVRHV